MGKRSELVFVCFVFGLNKLNDFGKEIFEKSKRCFYYHLGNDKFLGAVCQEPMAKTSLHIFSIVTG